MKQVLRIGLVIVLAIALVALFGKSYIDRVEAKKEIDNSLAKERQVERISKVEENILEKVDQEAEIHIEESSNKTNKNQFEVRMSELEDELEVVGSELEIKFANMDELGEELEDVLDEIGEDLDSDNWGENFGEKMASWGVNFGETMAEFGTSLGDSLEEVFTD